MVIRMLISLITLLMMLLIPEYPDFCVEEGDTWLSLSLVPTPLIRTLVGEKDHITIVLKERYKAISLVLETLSPHRNSSQRHSHFFLN